MLGLIIGVALLITVLSVMNGFDRELRTRILGMVPHAVIKPYATMQDWQSVDELVTAHPKVVSAAPFIQIKGMLSASGLVQGAQLNGVLPEEEKTVSIIENHMVQGSLDDLQSGEFRIVLGDMLARQLRVQKGDRVTVVLPEASLTPAGVFPRLKRFTVSGIFRVGADLDGQLALSFRTAARKAIGLPFS